MEMNSRLLKVEEKYEELQKSVFANENDIVYLKQQLSVLATSLNERCRYLETAGIDARKILVRIEDKLDEIYPQFLTLVNLMQVFARVRGDSDK